MQPNDLKIHYVEVDETLHPCISVLYVYFNYSSAPNIIFTKADYIYLDLFRGPTVIYLN